ncbi:multiple epidermal growth factor-like domains protein 10 [Gigantopelta aegis]|uniref:multiple epidermal growth factor-like domains protein 10 n=1 Tax=Gigantopelta aegis TaxID=1735272 RepID=UPI001B887897|nr:multiple epidermal growth factor-like domains protein 10 [Gigantopelta aegis]
MNVFLCAHHTECDGKYGSGCSYSCSERKCRDPSAPCDHVTGSCNGGCLDGWQGDTCTTKTDSGNDVLLIASIVVAVAVVIIVVIIVVVFFRWRRRRIRKDNSHETLVLGRPSRNTEICYLMIRYPVYTQNCCTMEYLSKKCHVTICVTS